MSDSLYKLSVMSTPFRNFRYASLDEVVSRCFRPAPRLCPHAYLLMVGPGLGRLHRALESKFQEAQALQQRTGGPERPYVRQLLRPAIDMLEAALNR